MAPAAAATMALLLFLYARTSIRAAKLNAQRHREADGGQIDWRNHSRRLHGQDEKLRESTLREAFVEQMRGTKSPVNESGQGGAAVRTTGTVEGSAIVGGRGDGERLLEEAKVRRKFGEGREG